MANTVVAPACYCYGVRGPDPAKTTSIAQAVLEKKCRECRDAGNDERGVPTWTVGT